MPIAWLRELLRRRRRVLIKPRTHDLRVLGFEEMEDRRLLALPPGITTSTFSAPWINMGPSVIATNPASGTLSGITVNNGSVPESQGLGSPAPSDPVEGGVTAIAVDPANSNIGWVGTTNGGIFQTQNLQSTTGPTWVPQLDQNKALSIGSIYADPTDATGNTVVAGIAPESTYNTQDSDQSGVVGAGSATPVGSTVRGVYRSTNAASTAATWTLLNGFPQDSSHNYISVVEQGSVIMRRRWFAHWSIRDVWHNRFALAQHQQRRFCGLHFHRRYRQSPQRRRQFFGLGDYAERGVCGRDWRERGYLRE